MPSSKAMKDNEPRLYISSSQQKKKRKWWFSPIAWKIILHTVILAEIKDQCTYKNTTRF